LPEDFKKLSIKAAFVSRSIVSAIRVAVEILVSLGVKVGIEVGRLGDELGVNTGASVWLVELVNGCTVDPFSALSTSACTTVACKSATIMVPVIGKPGISFTDATIDSSKTSWLDEILLSTSLALDPLILASTLTEPALS
jgi:hypothetical protein